MNNDLVIATPVEIELYRKAANEWFRRAFPHMSITAPYSDIVAEYMANQDGVTLIRSAEEGGNIK